MSQYLPSDSNEVPVHFCIHSKTFFHDGDGDVAITIDIDAGTVQLSEKYRDKLDDAAKLFWERVQQFAATCK